MSPEVTPGGDFAYAACMILPLGDHDVPAGALAAVVTHLEMPAALPPRPEHTAAPWALRQVPEPTLAWYRDLFHRVGADWLWTSRLALSDDALAGILRDPQVAVYTLTFDGRDEGLLELDFRVPGECELAFFGVTPALVGTGAGRWLMNRAIALAWARPIERFWLHTCSLDAPTAVPFYVRSGFVPYARTVEIFDDPRLSGLLPRQAAGQVPVIE